MSGGKRGFKFEDATSHLFCFSTNPNLLAGFIKQRLILTFLAFSRLSLFEQPFLLAFCACQFCAFVFLIL